MTAVAGVTGAAEAMTVGTDYEMVVGLEVHVQLKTQTKIFCNCSTNFGAAPNSNTCPVCLALPGALPVLNKHAVELAVRAALALGCDVHPVSVFARKNYFYPDLPKGYQISQFDQPLATGGTLEGVRITRIHMEEDAGKSIHDRFAGASAIDLNRAGVPLVEIVSEPDIRSAEQAGAYLRALKQVLEYTGVSDVSMEEGSLRVDANVSVRPRGETDLRTKTEVKNMNSFSNVERALAFEFQRQCSVYDSGGEVHQTTLLWDANRGEARPARSKEGSHDYRYFPEPDLRPLMLDKDWVGLIQSELPELPAKRKERYAKEYHLGEYEVNVLTINPRTADYFESVARAHGDPKAACTWVMGEVSASLNSRSQDIADFSIPPKDLVPLLDMVRDGVVSRAAAKTVFTQMLETGKPAAQIAEEEGLLQVSDDSALEQWIEEVFKENPIEAERYKNGDSKLKGVLVGLVMKKSKGSADPKKVNEMLGKKG